MERDYNEQKLEHEQQLNEAPAPIDEPGTPQEVDAHTLQGTDEQAHPPSTQTEQTEPGEEVEDAPSNEALLIDEETVAEPSADRQEEGGDEEEEDRLTIPEVLPILPLKETVIYPFSVQPLAVGQERSVRLIDDVMRGNRLVVLVAQKSADIEQAGPDEIFKVGTVARVGRMFRMPDGTVQIAVQG